MTSFEHGGYRWRLPRGGRPSRWLLEALYGVLKRPGQPEYLRNLPPYTINPSRWLSFERSWCQFAMLNRDKIRRAEGAWGGVGFPASRWRRSRKIELGSRHTGAEGVSNLRRPRIPADHRGTMKK
ncbi:MAG: hypothetical protein AAB403_10730 [Planctomycetota bacterium]